MLALNELVTADKMLDTTERPDIFPMQSLILRTLGEIQDCH